MNIIPGAKGPVRDYTKSRLGSLSDRGRKIAVCPECGQKGEATTYRGGDQHFVHRVEFDGLGWSTTVGISSHYISADRP